MLSKRSDCTWADLKRRLAGAAGAVDDKLLWLEGYGPGYGSSGGSSGPVVLLGCDPSDAVRTRAEVKSLFLKRGGQLGAPGSIAYLFRQSGSIRYPPGTDPERLGQLAYAGGAEEVVAADGGSVEVLTDPARLHEVSAHLAARTAKTQCVPLEARVLWRAQSKVRLSGDDARSLLQLLLELQDRADVRCVYSNAEIPDEIVAQL